MKPIEIGLYGGGRFTIREGAVDVSAVTPLVLAHGLSNVTRFGGQTPSAYSVAEHSVRMHDWAKKDGQDKAVLRAILLHDAPECLGEGDHQRFVKRAFFGDGPHKYASMVCTALWDMHCPRDRPPSLWTWEGMHDVLQPYDENIGSLEARAFGFPHEPIPDWMDCSHAPDVPWSADVAKVLYLLRWEKCE